MSTVSSETVVKRIGSSAGVRSRRDGGRREKRPPGELTVAGLGMLLLGHCSQIDDEGACIIGDNLLVLMNSHDKEILFKMPRAVQKFRTLDRLFDTFDGNTTIVPCDTARPYALQPQSMALFRHRIGL